MIKYIKDSVNSWWKSEHCFAKNPLFWLLTAGACVAAPFTGFLSLAAIPVLAGLAQSGNLSYDKPWAFFKWVFSGSSMKKGKAVLQGDVDSATDGSADELNASAFDAASNRRNLSLDAQSRKNSYEGLASLLYSEQVEENFDQEAAIRDALSDLSAARLPSQPSQHDPHAQLVEEAILLLEWLYHYRRKLALTQKQIEEIDEVLKYIPEASRPSNYSEERKATFFIWSKPGKPGIFFDDENFDAIMEKSGKIIGSRLLLRFHEDKTGLPKQEGLSIPLKISGQQVQKTTLQSVCQMLNRLLGDVFIQRKKESKLSSKSKVRTAGSSWKVTPAFWAKCDRLEAQYDKIIEETDKEIVATEKKTQERRKRIAEMDERHEQFLMEKEDKYSYQSYTNTSALYAENLASIRQKIETDDGDFSTTRSLMKSKISQGYIINPEDINELVKKGDLTEKTVKNLILAIIRKDIPLAQRCLQAPQDSQGFITQNMIESLVQEGKLPAKALQKLGFASSQQTGSSFFASLLTKNPSSGSLSSHRTPSPKGTTEGDEAAGKKKVVTPI